MVAFGSQRTACRSWFSFHQDQVPLNQGGTCLVSGLVAGALSTGLLHWPLFMSNNVPYTHSLEVILHITFG